MDFTAGCMGNTVVFLSVSGEEQEFAPQRNMKEAQGETGLLVRPITQGDVFWTGYALLAADTSWNFVNLPTRLKKSSCLLCDAYVSFFD